MGYTQKNSRDANISEIVISNMPLCCLIPLAPLDSIRFGNGVSLLIKDIVNIHILTHRIRPSDRRARHSDTTSLHSPLPSPILYRHSHRLGKCPSHREVHHTYHTNQSP